MFEQKVEKPGFIRKHRKPLAVAVIIIAVIAIVDYALDNPLVGSTEDYAIRIVEVAGGLKLPWSLAFLPNGDMLVTEKWVGRLRIIRNGVLQPEPISGVPAVHGKAQGGLLDVALHPDFKTNGLIYLTYAKPGNRGSTTALARAHFDGAKLTDVQDIFIADAWSFDNGQYGSRLAFDRAGFLYMTVGDRRDQPLRAQDPRDHAGKVLRLRDDGTAPPDNPFIGKNLHRPEIFAYGFRNPDGLAIHPETGAIFENEFGPLGGDEVNLIQAGRNYGWPAITYGRDYSGAIISKDTARPGMEQPLAYWVPSISPSGLVVYTGDKFPRWHGNLFLGALSGRHLRRIVLDGTRIVSQESLLTRLRKRIRDVRQGLDGFLYVVTDDDPGSVLRIEPVS